MRANDRFDSDHSDMRKRCACRRIGYLLLAVMLLYSSTVVIAEEPLPPIELTSSVLCGYCGLSYKWLTHPNLGDFWPEKGLSTYSALDSVPSQYDRPEVRDAIRAEIEKYRNPACIWARWMGDVKGKCIVDMLSPRLVAEYHFPTSPNVVLLKYGPVTFFAYYFESTGKAYLFGVPFDEGSDLKVGPRSVTDTWNAMIDENPGIIREDPLCIAAITSMFRFCFPIYSVSAPMIVLDSYDELLSSIAFLHMAGSTKAPYSLLTYDDLCLSHLSSDTSMLPYISWDSIYTELKKQIRSFQYEDSLTYSPPSVSRSGDTATIVMTVCGSDADGIRRCEVVIDGNGCIVRERVLQGPFQGPINALRESHRCPPLQLIRNWWCR
jgi:hypothetical protein